MTRASWNGATTAESDDIVVVEGNAYFPPEAVHQEYLAKSETHTTCPWKGEASYYDVTVNGKTNADAAWYYANPIDAVATIKDRIAFWKGVKID